MFIPPTYQITKIIASRLAEIEKLKTELDFRPYSSHSLSFKRKASLLKSSLFSARIEGNKNILNDLKHSNWRSSNDLDKLEVSNVLTALEFLLGNNWQNNISVNDLKVLHKKAMHRIDVGAGVIRSEPSAIYNMAGIAVYVCPLPQEIPILIDQLLAYVNGPFEDFIPIKAVLTHHIFEKIHPFLDGNGRTGRLLIHLVLKKWGYDFKGLAPFEEFIETYRSDYYDLIAVNRQDQTGYVEFMLEAFVWALQEGIRSLSEGIEDVKPEDELPLRRAEILRIIRDHQVVSFDFIQRRFIRIPPRTLRYDLMMLCKKGFVKKRGVTKGVVYELV